MRRRPCVYCCISEDGWQHRLPHGYAALDHRYSSAACGNFQLSRIRGARRAESNVCKKGACLTPKINSYKFLSRYFPVYRSTGNRCAEYKFDILLQQELSVASCWASSGVAPAVLWRSRSEDAITGAGGAMRTLVWPRIHLSPVSVCTRARYGYTLTPGQCYKHGVTYCIGSERGSPEMTALAHFLHLRV